MALGSILSVAQTHPYLFFDQEDILALQGRAHSSGTPAYEIWNDLILDMQADYYSGLGADEFAGDFWIRQNLYSLALAYVIEEDPFYLDQLRVILWDGFPPSVEPLLLVEPCTRCWHNADRVVALCLVLDLLWDDFSEEERQDIKDAIASDIYTSVEGLRSYVTNPYSYLYQSNHLSVRGSALGIAAMTLMGDPVYPHAASDLDLVRERLLTASDSYLKRIFPDGSCTEGIYYGFVGINPLLVFTYALGRWDATDYFNQADLRATLVKIPDALSYELLPNPRTDYPGRYFNDINDSPRGFFNNKWIFH
jgi:hypothetical protein